MTNTFKPGSNPVLGNQKILWIFSILAVQHALLLWLYYWPGSLPDGVTSGVWMGLAMDFSQGEFYRPLLSDAGYGGTRYMPLFWVLHGLGIRWFGHPLATGLELYFFSLLLFHGGLVALMIRMNISIRNALAFACLPLAALSYQMTTLNIRGDFLASAFGLWGLWCVAHPDFENSKNRLAVSVLLFGLAFATKLTALYFPLAACLYLYLSGRKTHSVLLAGGVVWTVAFILVLCNVVSSGRFWESFSATATGGMDPASAFSFLKTFGFEMIRDPFFLIVFTLTLGAGFYFRNKAIHRLSFVYFGVTLIATLVIYTSPGTATNHLIDLIAASTVLLATLWDRVPVRLLFNPVFLFMAGYLILAWHPRVISVSTFFEQHRKPEVGIVDWFDQKYGDSSHPILSRFSYFEVLRGQRPYTLDRFNLDLLTRTNRKIRRDFEHKIRQRYFGTVIESNWPGLFRQDFETPYGPAFESMKRDFHRHYDRDDPWHSLIRQYYRVDRVRRPFVFLVPREQPLNTLNTK